MIISLITTTFNSSRTLRDTFDSVLRQSYKDIEYIVVDGGSSDGTVDIIKEYEPRFEGRMRWLSEPDKGIYDAMNKGLALATGDVAGFLNSDDFFDSDDVLSRVAVAFGKDSSIDAVYGDVDYVRRDDVSKVVRHYSSKVFKRGLMRLGFMPAHPSFYCRRELYSRFDISYKIAADFENLLRILFVNKANAMYLPFTFVTMRDGGVSSSGISSHLQINKDHHRALRENGVYSNYLLLSIRYFYKICELTKVK